MSESECAIPALDDRRLVQLIAVKNSQFIDWNLYVVIFT